MKKTTLIHSDISHLIANLGHKDAIVIADSGLPVPNGVRKIDLALTKGVPPLLMTLEVVLEELCVEEAWIAQEMTERNAPMYERLTELLGNIPLKTVTHEQFKEKLRREAAAVIRTGEYSPFANVMLVSGVVF